VISGEAEKVSACRALRPRKVDIRVVARYGGGELGVYYIKVLPDLSIVIGTELPGFQVRRIAPDGDFIDGDDGLVDQPHVTFHPPAYFHLRADRKPIIFSGLVWTLPEPGKVASPWLNFISPPLSAEMFAGPYPAASKRKTIWPLDIPQPSGSLCMITDFVPPVLATQMPPDPTARFVAAGEIMVRVRVAMTESQPALVALTVEG
jgi:hypothetical protein